jgi:hypothetical protein
MPEPSKLRCPFCGAAESERFVLEGRRFLVFPCQFTPEFDPALEDAELARRLAAEFGPGRPGYFRRTCDRLHLYVTKGEGARTLGAPPEEPTG